MTKHAAGTIRKTESLARLKKLASSPAIKANSNGIRGRSGMSG
jgi:hypothetical protein